MTSMTTQQRLIYMANQIALNMAMMPHDKAVAALADHVAMFWDPRMKSMIFADSDGLSPIAADAIAYLRQGGMPAHQTQATEFNAVGEAGHSDAG